LGGVGGFRDGKTGASKETEITKGGKKEGRKSTLETSRPNLINT